MRKLGLEYSELESQANSCRADDQSGEGRPKGLQDALPYLLLDDLEKDFDGTPDIGVGEFTLTTSFRSRLRGAAKRRRRPVGR
ncbi:MAG: hypothetical protein WDN06_18695 [Asticcacaulis sp.]